MDETLSEIGRVFRSVGKLVREKTEDYFGNLTPVERALREVNDEDTCTIPNSLLRELAKASNDLNSYHPIMQSLWQGLAQEGPAWRRTYKSLSLLEYVLLFGPPRALEDCKHAAIRIKYLCGFRYHDGTREQGGGVRQKAHYILELLDQPEALAAAKAKAVEDSERYVGIENRPVFDMSKLGTSSAIGGPPAFGSRLSDSRLSGERRQWSPFFAGPPPGPPSDNPFTTINSFQSEAQARRTWKIPVYDPPTAPVGFGYDAPITTAPGRSLSGSQSGGRSTEMLAQSQSADNDDPFVTGAGPLWNDNGQSTSGHVVTSTADDFFRSDDVFGGKAEEQSRRVAVPRPSPNLLDLEEDPPEAGGVVLNDLM
eukprot:Protomagalhaensia_wolfi_Nauph_80__1770@NODE_20_length_4859_cov_275_667427_g15_i0_p1_GENE_NODE_20_length_4859_cov_275_667427_g15_i0NODE_20_length_4859_cov_275_667427_g15_i0_p1_ORF_typecomplete_len368_score73_86ENTH/PF01417_20/8_1e22_NODE_20_length_4859_cov_275_667427_g15_i021743277